MMKMQIVLAAGTLELDKKQLRATWRAAGNEIKAVTRRLISKRGGSGRSYSAKGFKYHASAPGEPPVSLTGTLRGSIIVRPYKSGEGVAVRNTAFYDLFLERGAKGGGGNTRSAANILRAGETNKRGRVLRGRNRMKTSAISKTRVLAERPSLERVIAERFSSIEKRVYDSFVHGVKFTRQRR